MARFNEDVNGNNTTQQAGGDVAELKSIISAKRQEDLGSRNTLFKQLCVCPKKPVGVLCFFLHRLAELVGGFIKPAYYSEEYTVKCGGEDGCKAIFDMETYSAEVLDDCIYKLFSAAQQLKLLDGGPIEMDSQGREDLKNIISMFPALSAMVRTHQDALKKAAGGGGKHKKMRPNGGGKGGIGLASVGGNGGRMY